MMNRENSVPPRPEPEVRHPSLWQAFAGKARRAFLCLFRPSYVKKSIERREGECNMCGQCCRIGVDCPFLEVHETHARCRIYHMGRPTPCQAFPIDARDLRDVGGSCSFRFSEPPSPVRRPEGELPVWTPASLIYRGGAQEAEVEEG